MKFATKAIHAGSEPDPLTGAVMPPIYMTSTYVQEAPGINKGYDYTRANNPNFVRLEQQLAALEGAEHATVFSSGIGALSAMVTTLAQGDRVVALDGVYGGTWRLFNNVFNHFGVTFESHSSDDLENALKSNPKWLLFETPTNPLLEVFDIAHFVEMAHAHGALVIVDNTFASPYCQNPLSLGADVVWHSCTKYLGGHSDVIGGVVMTNLPELKEKLDFARKAIGVNPSPFDCWLITRGVKTLAVRMEQHQRNALAVAEFLEKHPKVKRVYYPGLPSHPQHAIAVKQMHGFSGMLSAEFHLSLEETKKLISSFKLFALAESLGGVESLVSHPAIMTHASIPAQERTRMGITDGLVRFSVGIEDASDLIEDLQLAISK
ncbi:MAG: PLP-dependent aspartate aminotransferase family protein [Parachlamydia sp.]|nr:PLP-dependent aspartate aminotransferase family protein [Parachlamydia sp.]